MRRSIVAVSLAAGLTLSGCMVTEEGAVGMGAGVGASVGAIGTALAGVCIPCGALIGAAAGAAAGFVHYDRNRAIYEAKPYPTQSHPRPKGPQGPGDRALINSARKYSAVPSP